MEREKFRVWIKDVLGFEEIILIVEFSLEFDETLLSPDKLRKVHEKAEEIARIFSGHLFKIEKEASDGEWDAIALETEGAELEQVHF